MAGPLDELVKRILRRIEVFKEEHTVDDVQVSIELIDGSLHRLKTLSSEPGFGFVSFRPHGTDEPEELIVPVGAVREIRIGMAESEQVLGFAGSSATS
jgi:hypothetical protein